MEKTEARRLGAESVWRLTLEEKSAKSREICRLLSRMPELERARTIMAYLPLEDEVDLRPLLSELLAAGKTVCVPRTVVRERLMFPVRLKDLNLLREGEYGIHEPDSEERVNASEVEFILIPGRAFDCTGNRVGRGAGFYDRFMGMKDFCAFRCGVCFECQLLPAVPHTEADQPMQTLVTEKGIFCVA